MNNRISGGGYEVKKIAAAISFIVNEERVRNIITRSVIQTGANNWIWIIRKKGSLHMARKRAIRPTRRQKQIISKNRLHPDNWLVVGEDSNMLYLINKSTKRNRKISLKG